MFLIIIQTIDESDGGYIYTRRKTLEEAIQIRKDLITDVNGIWTNYNILIKRAYPQLLKKLTEELDKRTDHDIPQMV